MGGSSGGGTTTTNTTATPWGGVQPYLKNAYAQLRDYANAIPAYFPDQTYANFDPLQEYAMGGQVDYANSGMLNQSIGDQFGALNYGLNSVYDPESNPVLSRYVDSATRPITQAYEQAIGNTIAGNAVGAGGLGGSRQGVAEGLATRSYLDALQDTSTDIYNNAYNQGLDQQARMMAMAPQTMQMGLMPYDIMGQVGGAYQGMQQNAINEAMSRYDYDQNAGYARYKDYIAALQGNPYGVTSTTGPNPNQSNALASMLGGGALGIGATSMPFFSAGGTGAALGSALGGWALPIGGALLGGLF